MAVTGDLSEINSLMMVIHGNISLVVNISTLYVSHKSIVAPWPNFVKLAWHSTC